MVDGINGVKAGFNITATYADGMLTISGAEGCTLRVYDVAGRELATYHNAAATVRLRVPQTECIVSATAAKGQTVVKKVMRR